MKKYQSLILLPKTCLTGCFTKVCSAALAAFPQMLLPSMCSIADKSTDYRPAFKFTPFQGLAVALSQYAPGKEVWIAGKQYRSGADLFPSKKRAVAAWGDRAVLITNVPAGYAEYVSLQKGETGRRETVPPVAERQPSGKYSLLAETTWICSPDFQTEETSPDDQPGRVVCDQGQLAAPTELMKMRGKA